MSARLRPRWQQIILFRKAKDMIAWVILAYQRMVRRNNISSSSRNIIMLYPLYKRLYWREKKPNLAAIGIGVVGIVLVVLFALIIVGYRFDWTGFNGYTQVTIAHTTSGPSTGTVVKTEVYQPGKALWDWLQLLIIPVVLAVGALLFNLATTRTEQKIALDKQREDLFQKYLDCMSDLLLKENLRSSAVDAEARKFARVRTITILFQLDARRIGLVFGFLREAGLMSIKPESNIVSLSQANLREINLSQALLVEANLSRAVLSQANLSRAVLSQANLSRAVLVQADLSFADLSGADLSVAGLNEANLSRAVLVQANLSFADLSGANLSRAVLSRTSFSGANLSEANLSRAKLWGADLGVANLSEANLSFTDLSGATFSGADLSQADLRGAKGITIEELEKQAKSLSGATMPDGKIHS